MVYIAFGISAPYPGPPYEIQGQGYIAYQPPYPSNTGIPRVPVNSHANAQQVPELPTPYQNQEFRAGEPRMEHRVR
jgi:hypothetical protein